MREPSNRQKSTTKRNKRSAPQVQIATIGVYGFTEDSFFQKLLRARVTVFFDIRRRRGVRGSRYAFANSKRLQSKLATLGIRYIHLEELAPSNAIRQLQKDADRSSRTTQSQRSRLSEKFIAAYQAESLSHFKTGSFLRSYDLKNQVIVFFCVEREPNACHRSLVAERCSRDLGVVTTHLTLDGDRSEERT